MSPVGWSCFTIEVLQHIRNGLSSAAVNKQDMWSDTCLISKKQLAAPKNIEGSEENLSFIVPRHSLHMLTISNYLLPFLIQTKFQRRLLETALQKPIKNEFGQCINA